MINHKKFYIFLTIVIAVFLLLLIYQIKQTMNIDITPSDKPLVNYSSVMIPLDKTDQIFGNPGAPLTIVEFIDFNCADCRSTYYTIYDFVAKHPRDARFILKDAPAKHLFSSAEGAVAHQAAFCAGKQKKYWEFVNLLLQDPANLRAEGLKKVADGVKLNTLIWEQCLNSDEAKQKVVAGITAAQSIGIKKLPAVFANNKQIDLGAGADLTEMLGKMIAP